MPLVSKSPPAASSTVALKDQSFMSLTRSDPNLSLTLEDDSIHVSQRIKRKRNDDNESALADNFKAEILNMFNEIKLGQITHASSLQSTKEDLMAQNNQLQESVEFMSRQYDELLNRIKKAEEDRDSDRKYIHFLEGKIENLERQNRIASLEIRNIPKKDKETKKDLVDTVVELGEIINVEIQPMEIKRYLPYPRQD
ncbi:unnamed protein product [Diatraea saccharalis]|uniref:Uncharacterized protein n=1 Tax=Diatraea saccharalis TaxID=40085 RepID=A0A9N9RE51_9NEOP|nr:unnamed protein product [Diatraea saccharalis]